MPAMKAMFCVHACEHTASHVGTLGLLPIRRGREQPEPRLHRASGEWIQLPKLWTARLR